MAVKKRIVKAAKKRVADDMDMARKIWLAGVGAYARATADAQGRIGKLAAQADKQFDELVIQGERMEDDVRALLSGNKTAGKVADMVDAISKQADAYRAKQAARVAGVRKQVEEKLAPLNPMLTSQSVKTLSAKVDALTAEVARMKGDKPARASAAKAKPTMKAVKAPRTPRRKTTKAG
jgi:polyhydroxyalkanoate synthesis regulator phasin